MTISAEAGQDVLPTIDALVLRVQDAQFATVAPLAITRWLTEEPVGFAQREGGERAEVAPGVFIFSLFLPVGSGLGAVQVSSARIRHRKYSPDRGLRVSR